MTFRLISYDGNRVEDEDEAGRAPYISLRAGRRGAAAEVTLRSAGSVMSRRATPPHTHYLFIHSSVTWGTQGAAREAREAKLPPAVAGMPVSAGRSAKTCGNHPVSVP